MAEVVPQTDCALAPKGGIGGHGAKHVDLHGRLPRVRGPVLDHLDRPPPGMPLARTLEHLRERPLPEEAAHPVHVVPWGRRRKGVTHRHDQDALGVVPPPVRRIKVVFLFE